MSSLCDLCGLEINFQKIYTDEKKFCCHGCQTVFQILFAKDALINAREHPVFQEALKSGIISNPLLLEEINAKEKAQADEESICYYLEINEMWCFSCSEVIKIMLLRHKGIQACKVDYATDLASIKYNPRLINKEEINEMITKLGYRPSSLQDAKASKPQTYLKLRSMVAAFCSLNIMMFSYPIYASTFYKDQEGYSYLLAWLAFFASLPLVTWCFWPILKRGLTSIRARIFGMETLVILGVGSAFFLSLFNLLHDQTEIYFDSMSSIITFVLVGKIFESKAKFSSKDSLLRVFRATPKRARKKMADGTVRFVPLKEITIGDQLAVVSGEKIVLDGKVISGQGICDESVMTGEALPRHKKEGESLIAGAFLQNGSLVYEVTATFEETTLHKIFDAIENDISHKVKYSRAVDSIVKYFIPAVIVLAIFSSLFTYFFVADTTISAAIIKIVSILLISCPCAIGIAAPLAESYLINEMAKNGALIRNRGCLTELCKLTHFVADKTGTITEGNFKIIKGLEELSSENLQILKSIAQHSTHPISVAIANKIEKPVIELDCVEEFSGKGMRALYQEKIYYLGSSKFLQQEGISSVSENSNTDIDTEVFFAKEKDFSISLKLGDEIKKCVPKFIEDLAPLKTILLSGDNFKTVKNVAEKCHFDEFYAEVSPLLKREVIEEIKSVGGVVAMIGDGINDAPALTSSHIGISVLSASDISIHVSDIFLTTEDLGLIPKLIHIARKAQKIIKQNLFWAFFYNIIGITLAIAGFLTPLFAAGAMILSSLIVILNARRLNFS